MLAPICNRCVIMGTDCKSTPAGMAQKDGKKQELFSGKDGINPLKKTRKDGVEYIVSVHL